MKIKLITQNLVRFIKTHDETDLYNHLSKIKKWDKAASSKLNAQNLDQLFINNIPSIYLDYFLTKNDSDTNVNRQIGLPFTEK